LQLEQLVQSGRADHECGDGDVELCARVELRVFVDAERAEVDDHDCDGDGDDCSDRPAGNDPSDHAPDRYGVGFGTHECRAVGAQQGLHRRRHQ
jgi:hypothetical protein